MATVAAREGAPKRPWLAAVLSAVVPGGGQLYVGRARRALVWFAPIAIFAMAAVPLASIRLTDLIGLALEPRILWLVFGMNIVSALWRIAAAADAFALARGRDHSAIGLAVGWAVLGFVVLAPHLVVGRYTYDAVTLVDTVFVIGDEAVDEPVIPIGTDADIVPDPIVTSYEVDGAHLASTRNLIFRDGVGDPDAVAVWDDIVADANSTTGSVPFPAFTDRVGEERITILFAGGDAGPGRGGLRTDAMMVGSIDTATGTAALFSFPRNLGHTPLPRRFATAFVELEKRLAPEPEDDTTGTSGDGGEQGATTTTTRPPAFESCRCFPEQLNALYPFTRRWTRTYPDEVDPGMAALRDTLGHLMGLEIDYYALIDMAAFVDLVDAIGGIDVYALQPLESEVSPPREGDPWAYVNVQPGWNHLDGPEALAYARARKDSSDYARMERQRCMVKAVAAKADALTLLRSFPAIVDAMEGSVVTDIPLTFLPDLLEAAAGLGFDDIETVGFTHSYWESKRDHLGHPVPNMNRIRWKVRSVFEGQVSTDEVTTGPTECEV